MSEILALIIEGYWFIGAILVFLVKFSDNVKAVTSIFTERANIRKTNLEIQIKEVELAKLKKELEKLEDQDD